MAAAADPHELEFLLRSLLRRLIEEGRISTVRASELKDLPVAARHAIDELESRAGESVDEWAEPEPETPKAPPPRVMAPSSPPAPPAPAKGGWIRVDDPNGARLGGFQPVPDPVPAPMPTWPPAPTARPPMAPPMPPPRHVPAMPMPRPEPAPAEEEPEDDDEMASKKGGRGATQWATTSCPRCKAKVTYSRKGDPPYLVECKECGARGKLKT